MAKKKPKKTPIICPNCYRRFASLQEMYTRPDRHFNDCTFLASVPISTRDKH